MSAIFLFQHGNSGNFQQQEANHQRADYRRPAVRQRQSEQENAPPHRRLTEVIRMPCAAPEPGRHDFAPIGGILFKATHLVVSDSLKKETDHPDHTAGHFNQTNGGERRNSYEYKRVSHDQHDQALQHENLQVAA